MQIRHNPRKGQVMVIKHLLAIIILVLVAGTPLKAAKKSYTVFDIRRTIPLKNSDPVFRDYYINLGSDHGAQVGSEVRVYRRVPVVDIYRNRAQEDLKIEIGRLKVIHTQKTMSVARLFKKRRTKDTPVLKYETIMMGDRVEIASLGTVSGDKEMNKVLPQITELPEKAASKPASGIKNKTKRQKTAGQKPKEKLENSKSVAKEQPSIAVENNPEVAAGE